MLQQLLLICILAIFAVISPYRAFRLRSLFARYSLCTFSLALQANDLAAKIFMQRLRYCKFVIVVVQLKKMHWMHRIRICDRSFWFHSLRFPLLLVLADHLSAGISHFLHVINATLATSVICTAAIGAMQHEIFKLQWVVMLRWLESGITLSLLAARSANL